jgi:hypothetical protein
MMLYPAGMCRDTYNLPHLPRSRLRICKWPWTVQWNVLGRTAASKCEGLTTCQALTLSTVFLGVAVGLVQPKLRRYQQHPEHGGGVSAWNVGRSSYLGGLPEHTSINSVVAKASRLRPGTSFRHASCGKNEECRHHHLLQHKLLPADMNVTVGTIRSPEQLTSWFHSTALQLWVSAPGTAKTFFSSPKVPDPLWGPTSHISNRHEDSFLWVWSGRGVKLTTHI